MPKEDKPKETVKEAIKAAPVVEPAPAPVPAPKPAAEPVADRVPVKYISLTMQKIHCFATKIMPVNGVELAQLIPREPPTEQPIVPDKQWVAYAIEKTPNSWHYDHE